MPTDQELADPFWIFRPGTSPLVRKLFYVVGVLLVVTLIGLLGIMIVGDFPRDQIIHVCVFGVLALGLVGSVTWVLGMLDEARSAASEPVAEATKAEEKKDK
eukprot:c11376_g1_i1.p1 GENE.c11376_g1_i1~~c11376_g1_i1.p1  ORF type:complete len:102 (+),score=19.34 c11376_g1_i1:36-341(+)